MKRMILAALVGVVMFSSTSFAEWKEVTKNVGGSTFYVDFERIKKHDGYVYFWELLDYLKPTKHGVLSSKSYAQVDCKTFRYKWLSASFHKEPMGGGVGNSQELSEGQKRWRYPHPDSSVETVLKAVCQHAR